MPESHEARVRVRYSETDQMGVVYHANYLVWMEVGRVEFCRAAGVRYRDLEEQDGVLLAVVEANCRYYHPAFYDDEVIVRTSVAQTNRRGVTFEYELRDAATGRRLALGYTKHLFLSRQLRPVHLPRKYYAAFGLLP